MQPILFKVPLGKRLLTLLFMTVCLIVGLFFVYLGYLSSQWFVLGIGIIIAPLSLYMLVGTLKSSVVLTATAEGIVAHPYVGSSVRKFTWEDIVAFEASNLTRKGTKIPGLIIRLKDSVESNNSLDELAWQVTESAKIIDTTFNTKDVYIPWGRLPDRPEKIAAQLEELRTSQRHI